MAIGAIDDLDQALVRKYQSLKVDNATIQTSAIDPNQLMSTMNNYGNAHMDSFRIQQTLRNICSKAISMNIQYTVMEGKTKKQRMQEAAKKVVAAQMAKKNELAQKLAKDPRPEFA